MPTRWFSSLGFVAVTAALSAAVRAEPPERLKPLPAHGTGPQTTSPGPSSQPNQAGGIAWSVPKSWKIEPSRMLRVATYTVPAPAGSEPVECAVFHFGAGQGGGIEDNIRRWAGQFESSPTPERGKRVVHAMTVHTVALSGVFLSPSGPMMQSSGRKVGWRLLGAIVEAPGGNVFFKLTGPAAAVAGAAPQFDALVASLRKDS